MFWKKIAVKFAWRWFKKKKINKQWEGVLIRKGGGSTKILKINKQGDAYSAPESTL